MQEIAFDIINFLDDYEIFYKSSGKNVSRGWVEINCPFCDDPSTHLGINLDSKLFHCWICSNKGGPSKLVKALTQCSWEQAQDLVKRYTDWSTVEIIDEDSIPKKFKLPVEFNPITPNTIPQLVSEYLTKRNFIPEEVTRRFNLLYPGPIGKYKLRLIIPVYVKNRIVNFLARDLTDKAGNAYQNCPNEEAEILLSNLLYGIEEIPDGDPIVLVEGVFDQWRLGYGSSCIFRSNITSEQALILQKKKPVKIFTLLDPDMPEEQHRKIAAKLWFTEVEAVFLNTENDPAELSPDEARFLMRELRNNGTNTQKKVV